VQARWVGRCPACGEALQVERLRCPACATAVEGRFAPVPYAALDPERLRFLEVFLRARGNLREVERVLGLSYPTVRSRLDELLQALGFAEAPAAAPPPAGSSGRREVLEALARGEIDVAEAVARLRGEPRG
jgi:hypothetical protein